MAKKDAESKKSKPKTAPEAGPASGATPEKPGASTKPVAAKKTAAKGTPSAPAGPEPKDGRPATTEPPTAAGSPPSPTPAPSPSEVPAQTIPAQQVPAAQPAKGPADAGPSVQRSKGRQSEPGRPDPAAEATTAATAPGTPRASAAPHSDSPPRAPALPTPTVAEEVAAAAPEPRSESATLEPEPVAPAESAKPSPEPRCQAQDQPAADVGPAERADAGTPEPLPVPEPETETAADAAAPESQSAPVHWPSRPSLFVVHITPEMAPVAKVGGLADVVFGISREHAIRGNHVEIVLPKYDNLRYDHIFELHEVFRDLWVPWYEGAIHCTVYFGFVHGRKCFFIEPHSQDNFFNRGSIYGFRDDVMRFAFFSRAAMEFLWRAGKHPDVIHCHDWQTALVPVYLYEIYQQLGMTHPRVCLTIHNFQHQGLTGAELLRATGLHRPDRFFDWHRLGDNRHRGALNLLKGGIVYSNFVTTVSPRYAFETKDQGQGFGLEPTLHIHHMKYGGVVNGVDYDVWNPEVDRYIPACYGLDSIDAKYDNKRALRHRLMLADNEKPMVAFIGRLDPQKGLELVRHAIFYSLERGAQFVLLGSSPDHAINNDFWGLKRMLNDSPDCHLEIGFDEDLSHLIYAGADIVLVPSRFEPCGLTQLIALRYGTIPVVRTVGGLADTVFDKDHSDRPLDQRNGYRFDHYDTAGLESALGRAIDCYYQYPDHFRELMKNAMRADYSWNRPGQDYLNIYDFIRAR